MFLFRVADIMDGRGGGKKGRFQGKTNKLQNRSEAERVIRETVETRPLL